MIWAVIVVAAVNIYPTIGWMMLPDDNEWLALPEAEREKTDPAPGTRQARLVKWQREDDDFARERRSTFAKLVQSIKRWSEFDRSRVINLGLDLQGGIHMVLSFDVNELDPERLQEYRDRNYRDSDIENEVQEIILDKIRRRIDDFEATEPIIQALGSNQIQIQLPGERDIDRAKRLMAKAAVLNFHIVAEPEETIAIFTKIRDRFPDEFTPFIKRPALRGEPFKVPLEHADRVRRVIERARAAGDILPEGKTIAFSQRPKPYEPQELSLYVIDETPISSGEGLRSAVAIPDQSNPPYWQILFTFGAAEGARFGEATEKNINRAMAIVLDGLVVSAPVIRDRITTSGQITGSFEAQEAVDLAIALNSGSMVVPLHEEFTRVVGASLGADSVRKGVISALCALAIVGIFMVVYYLWAGFVAILTLAVTALLIVAAMSYFNLTLTLPGLAGLILTIGMAVDASVLIYERIREELFLGHSLASSIDAGFKRATVTILDANVTTLIAAAVLMQFGTGPIEGFAITLSIGVCSSVFCTLVVSRAIFDFLVERRFLTKLVMFSLIPRETHIPFLQVRNAAFALSAIMMIGGMALFVYRGNENYGVDFTQGTNINLSIEADQVVPVGDVRVALAQAGFSSPVVQRVGDESVLTENQFIVRVSDVNEDLFDRSVLPKPEKPQETDETTGEAPEPAGDAPETAGDDVSAEEDQQTDESAADALPEADATNTTSPPAAGASEADPAGDADNDGIVESITTAGPEMARTVADRMRNALAPLTRSGSPDEVHIEDEQTVGPAVGKKLRWDAVKAIFWALVFIVVYLALRFEFKFAVAAVAALFHDVLITLGIFALLRRQIDMNVVAALLTIVGYSLNDTIIVFDRIREDIKIYRGKGYKYLDILNSAINSTLSRTLITSMTTLVSVVVLFLFGGDAINSFALALIIGVCVGTYSSVFVASALVYVWQEWRGKLVLPTDTGKRENARRPKNTGKAKGRSQENGSPA